MRFVAAILLAILMPALVALAQSPAPVDKAGLVGTAEPPMPLWGTSDGRILAMVAFGANPGAPVAPQAPLVGSATDYQFVDITNFVTGGLSLRFGNNVNTYANFGRGIVLAPLNSAAVTLGCDSSFAFTLAALCPKQSTLANAGDVRVGTDVTAGQFDFDVNYGLVWLRNDAQAHVDGSTPVWNVFSTIGNEALPTVVIPNVQIASMLNSGISAQGRWHWDDTQSLDLGAALSRIQFDLPGNPLAPVFNQAALSFGVQRGNFSGVIVGRVLGPTDPLAGGQHWSTVDLGISWRAPWRGVFSVGAQNLWSSGTPPLLNEQAHEADPSQARVPYVQYHQDL
jgi:hypothetical protein